MSINDIYTTIKQSSDKTTKPKDYIISPCSFATFGLSLLFSNANREIISFGTDRDIIFTDYFHHAGERDSDRIIVFLPDEPLQVLTTLKNLHLLIQSRESHISVLLFSHLQPLWLYRTLQNLISKRKLLSAVRYIKPGKNAVQTLNCQKKNTEVFPLLEQVAKETILSRGYVTEGLTRRELDVILKLLNGNSMKAQSLNNELSAKTLYNQKVNGLKKLSLQFESLIHLLPGSERKRRRAVTKKMDNNFLGEGELTDAVRRGLLFHVYQPVTNDKMSIEGFEILSRWYQNGKELLPAEFLPQIRTVNSWILLTAYGIKNAIEKINQFQGEYWFSVNIPACLAGSPALLRMLNSAKKQLSTPKYLEKLVLEFSEDTDWSKNARPIEILRKLNEQNFQVFLDDCFSDKHVIFPVKQVSFSGYKLDMSVVSGFMNNAHDRYLIEGLVYYCHLTGSKCIAEGVDTCEKFLKLKNIGVTAFQGYYFSRPVLGEELEVMLSK